MHQIVKVNLDNEMDLILAHKRTMKLAELCGLSIPAQTTFATAVSEIARTAIGQGKKSYLVLSIDITRINRKDIVAVLYDLTDLSKANSEAFSYASRLSGNIESVFENGWYQIRLQHIIPMPGTVSPARIESFKEFFKNEPPLSPYDEIRKKNIQLIDLSDKLRTSESQYRQLTDTLPLVMFTANTAGHIDYGNKGLKDFLEDQQLLTSLPWHSLLHPDDLPAVMRSWTSAQSEKRAFKAEGRLKHRDRHIWHLISMVPVKDDKGSLKGWNGFFVDIQVQKQIEETLKDNRELKDTQRELRRYQHELETKINELNNSNTNLEQFAYIASHDLQEPLRKIKTYSSLLEHLMKLEPKEKYYFDKITSSSDRMAMLINNVLEYSRLSNKNESAGEVDLNLIMAMILEDFELMIEEKHALPVISHLPTVYGLPLQFTQLFSNLLSNALKFSSDSPEIQISSRLLTAEESGDIAGLQPRGRYHEITVRDNGIGFEQKYADQIFVIFQRLTDQSHTGTGIGLALCKKIVENHGGVILAEGHPGRGATFRIYLPAISDR